MKLKAFTFIVFLCCAIISAQQDYTKSLDGIDWVKIESKADLTIKTHDKNQLQINVGEASRIPERAKGLKLVGADGNDNTDVGFYVVVDGNNLIVKNLRKSEGAEIFLPASQKIAVKTTWQGDIDIQGFTGEIEASAEINGSISIKDVSGPITADVLNGELEVVFSKVNQSSPISLYTTNGELDVSLPASTPANLTLSTINGEVYTNFDISLPDKDGMKAIAAKKVRGSINNGGVDIQLKSTNGTIYLRKK
ncbi:MAG: DUF4097 family beta strand repeat-containing protein [Flavobacteriaceae bacterium]